MNSKDRKIVFFDIDGTIVDGATHTIPESTVEFQGDSAFVQSVKQEQPEQVFEKHPVKVGLSDGIKIEVQEGLAATDKVRGAAIDPNKK